jgi:hypothetical protein
LVAAAAVPQRVIDHADPDERPFPDRVPVDLTSQLRRRAEHRLAARPVDRVQPPPTVRFMPRAR